MRSTAASQADAPPIEDAVDSNQDVDLSFLFSACGLEWGSVAFDLE
jgi:hypothetical protein